MKKPRRLGFVFRLGFFLRGDLLAGMDGIDRERMRGGFRGRVGGGKRGVRESELEIALPALAF